MPYPTSSRPILSNARRDSAHRGCATKIKGKSVRAYSPPGTGGGGCAIKQNAAKPPLMAQAGVVDGLGLAAVCCNGLFGMPTRVLPPNGRTPAPLLHGPPPGYPAGTEAVPNTWATWITGSYNLLCRRHSAIPITVMSYLRIRNGTFVC